MWFTLDADDTNAPYFEILENTDTTITFAPLDPDGEAYLNNNDWTTGSGDLVGVHVFDTIQLENGVNYDFGEDRVIVLEPENSWYENGATVTSGPNSVYNY